MESYEKYKSTIGFIDILFNILVGIAFLFIVAFILIKPESKKEDFERKAEFVIIMEWPPGRIEDMDLWVQDPTGLQASYRAPQVNFMHLDKDDLGNRNDTVMIAGKRVTVLINREVVTIRGIMPGEYIINAHMYSNHALPSMVNGELVAPMQKGKLPVSVEVAKINPSFQTIYKGLLDFTNKGQEQTFYRFTVGGDGTITDFNNIEKKFIKPWKGTQNSPPRVNNRHPADQHYTGSTP